MKRVRLIYDPILRQEVKSVTVFNDKLEKLSKEMLIVMHKNLGMGLAANQLGFSQDLLVMEYRPLKGDEPLKPIGPLALCNARVVRTSQETETATEGCLSLPGLELPVTRPSGVTVEAQDLRGRSVTIKAKGLLARILQHEIDHLDGVLFTDRANGIKNIKNYSWVSIVFFGSDQFSTVILEGIIAAGLKVLAVVTETDKRSGRGDELAAPKIKALALANEIAVIQPASTDEITATLETLQPDLVILASYGKILPAEALKIPIYGCLNVHPSLLPKLRGATPLQTAILSGASETGVTIMKMNSGVDTGEIVAQTKTALNGRETFASLRRELSTAGSGLLSKTLPLYLSGRASVHPQNGEATQTTKLTKVMGEINWDDSAQTIDRQIRAFNPWPGTFTFVGEKRLKILTAMLDDGRLVVLTVQLEGKKPTGWTDFVRGYADELNKTAWYGKIQ